MPTKKKKSRAAAKKKKPTAHRKTTPRKKATPKKKATTRKQAKKKATAKKTYAAATSARTRGVTVDQYVAQLAPWARDLAEHVRALVAQLAPSSTCQIKWGQPVWSSADGKPVAWLRGSTAHVSFGFWRGAALADPQGLLEGDGDVMRHVKLASGAPVDDAALSSFVREAFSLS